MTKPQGVIQFVLLLGVLCSPAWMLAGSSPQSSAPAQKSDLVSQLWGERVEPILLRPVNSPAQAYQDAEMLMVPMHAAFKRNNLQWEQDFAQHFQRTLQNSSALPDQSLSRTFYLYFASQFLVLASSTGHADLIPKGLPDFVFSDLEAYWLRRPAIHYEHPAFTGMKARVLWKLNTRKVAKSYYRAIIDDELFAFSIAADLRTYSYHDTAERQRAWRLPLDDVISVADKVYEQEGTRTSSGGWLLQPGVWSDHPDFQYAGNLRAESGMRPKTVQGIGWDSSHFMRAPLLLTSLMNSFGVGSRQYNYYLDLRKALATQFFANVLAEPSRDSPCYRQKNFMDGSNGVYRWGYGNLGVGNGYGPYGVSGVLLIGWWAFLDTDQSRALYRDLAKQYPWPKECIALYLPPRPASQPYTDKDLDPNSPAMRQYHLLVLLASEL